MIITEELKYQFFNPNTCDADTQKFLEMFDEPLGRVVEVGSHDAPISNVLSHMGFDVTGFDLREYDPKFPPCNYNYRREDFCNPDQEWLRQNMGTFDVAIAISCIEHFGMKTYEEQHEYSPHYDVMAVRMMWHLLKEGGFCYVSVPFGGKFCECYPNWRIYNLSAFLTRIVQDFAMGYMIAFVADRVEIGGVIKHRGDMLTLEEIESHDDPFTPHVSALAKLQKIKIKRVAPDGR